MRENVVVIEGMSNLRDIGGYRAGGDGRVRRGMVFRSEALVFSGAQTKASIYREDNAYAYKRIAVKTIIDLRGAREAQVSPSAWPHATGAQLISFPMDAGGEGDATVIMQLLRNGKLRAFGVEDLARFYAAMARRLAPMFGDALNALAKPDRLPALIHCAAGKDRTGMLVAFLLEILGTPREEIVSDYAFTDVLRPNRVNQYREILEPVGVDPNAVRALFESPAETMHATLDGIKEEFGAIETFLTQSAGVTPATLTRLREALIEKT
jgi:protein-tyrosine phosphatase